MSLICCPLRDAPLKPPRCIHFHPLMFLTADTPRRIEGAPWPAGRPWGAPRRCRARRQDIMRPNWRAVCLITVAITSLALMGTVTAASASSGGGTAHPAKGCISVTATVHVGGDPDGVAADPKTNTVYVTNISGNTVSVISGRTNTVTATVRVGSGPDGVAVDPKSNTIYVANATSNTVSVISGQTNAVTATIRLGNFPFAVAVDPKTNTIDVTTFNANTVLLINGRTNTVNATNHVGSEATGIAVDWKTNSAYVANISGHTVSVLAPCPK